MREPENGNVVMARRVELDNVEHARLRVAARASNDLLVNQALVVPSEFEELQREYPILFRKDADGGYQAVALLGLDRGENLFLRGEAWIAHYVPATLRRGPLFLAVGEGEADDPGIVIELDDPRVSETEGEPLFLAHGGAGPFLQQAAQALRTVHEGLESSRRMFALFNELDLIAPVEIDVELGDGTRYRIPNVFTVSGERFAELNGVALEELNRTGFLGAAIYVRSSLANINRLIELKTRALAVKADA
jgi:hypothetical protein